MMKPFILLAKVLYGISLFVSVVNCAAIIFIHWEFILSGKGFGSFVVPWFIGYFIFSFLIFLVAHAIQKNKMLTILYWISIGVPVVLLVFFPVLFFVE
jgi:hypothetical protein